jgi:hypothetical protein
MKTEQKNVTRLGILHAITFGRDLFNSIATEGDPDEYPTGLKMSRKRYYTKLSKLVKTGLIKRKNGIYVLTLFGKAIYEVQLGFGTAVDDQSEIKCREDRDN